MSNLKLKAKAIVAVRKRRKVKADESIALEALEKRIAKRIEDNLSYPTPERGKDGRDAPTMEAIMAEIIPILPVPETREVPFGDIEDFVKGILPKEDKELRPKVEIIREEVSKEALDEYATKEDLDEALKRVQDAITYHSGGGESLSRAYNLIDGLTPDLITTTIDHTTSHSEVIICTNTTPIEVTLHDAEESDIVNIKRTDALVTVVGDIDGVTNKDINVVNYSMRLIYTGTEWNEI